MKHRLPDSSLNKHQVLQWINKTLKGNETKIESLGNGIVYCMLMNHYFPNSISHNKIIMMPKNNMDNKANLKKVQQALALQNIKSITFDIFRVSEMSYLDNWQLVCKLYKYFKEHHENVQKQVQKTSYQSESQQSSSINQSQTVIAVSQGNNSNQQANSHMNSQQHSQITQHNSQISSQQNAQQTSQINSQLNFIIPKEIPKLNEFTSGLMTPMKGLKYFEESTKLRFEALKLMQEIKSVVKLENESDKSKVRILKKMLGLIEQQSHEEELEMKELFSDFKKKQQTIVID